MNIADKLAIMLKANGRSNPDAILLGRSERQAIESNREPCDPPDFSGDGKTFCGIPVVWSPEETRFAVVFNLEANAKGQPRREDDHE